MRFNIKSLYRAFKKGQVEYMFKEKGKYYFSVRMPNRRYTFYHDGINIYQRTDRGYKRITPQILSYVGRIYVDRILDWLHNKELERLG